MKPKRRGRPGLTKRGAVLLLALIPVMLWFLREPDWVLPFFAGNSVLLFLFSLDFFSMPSPRQIVIERRFLSTWQMQPQRVELIVVNRSPGMVKGSCRDTPPPGFGEAPLMHWQLDSGDSAEFVYELEPQKRGRHEFGIIYVELTGRLGLVVQTYTLNHPDQVNVIPDLSPIKQVRWLSRRHLLQDAAANRRRLGEGTDFSKVREYVPGDEYRRVNWKVSAKLNRLHTNMYDVEKNQIVWLVLDAGRRMMIHTDGKIAFEHGISAVLALAQASLEQGDRVGLLIVADSLLTVVPPQNGSAQLRVLLQVMAGSAPMRRETDFMAAARYLGTNLRRRGLVCVFSSLGESQHVQWITQVLGPVRKKHLTLFLSLESQGARKWYRKQVLGVDEIFTKGAAQARLLQNKRACLELARTGVEVVSVPAGELALAGVQAYFRVRERI